MRFAGKDTGRLFTMARKIPLRRDKERRVYSNARIAHTLQFLSRPDMTITRASEQLSIPRSTLSQWKIRYLTDDEFAELIDRFIDESEMSSS